MRLINADNLKKRAKEALVKIPHGNFAESVINGFVEEINNEPTTYDVDKIVERLIRKSDCIEVLYKSNIERGNYSTATLLAQQVQTINECIDIVKGGGING